MPDWLWIAIAAVIVLPWVSQLVAVLKYSGEPSFKDYDYQHGSDAVLYLPGGFYLAAPRGCWGWTTRRKPACKSCCAKW